ncbi:unnamed protein product [Coregonus sp. 'balchen']|nr:unnamed protein product [Coregonus sp. 'balchen']
MTLMSQSSMLQGPQVLGHDKPLIRLSFTSCVVGTVSLPLLGVITCIFISSLFHFQDSTETHRKCLYKPEPRVPYLALLHWPALCSEWPILTSIYKGRFSTRFLEWLLSCPNFICAITENFGLLLFTYVFYALLCPIVVHKEGFVLFIASSVIHIVLTCRLWLVIKKT